MKLGIIIETKEPEKAWNAFRFATTARKQGHEVKVFLMGEAGSGWPRRSSMSRPSSLEIRSSWLPKDQLKRVTEVLAGPEEIIP